MERTRLLWTLNGRQQCGGQIQIFETNKKKDISEWNKLLRIVEYSNASSTINGLTTKKYKEDIKYHIKFND